MSTQPEQAPAQQDLRRGALRIMKLNGLTFADCVAVFTENQTPRELAYVKTARTYEIEGEVELDDSAMVSEGSDDGAYVMAWLWVPRDETDIVDLGEGY